MTFFFGFHLILGGKLDAGRRDDLFFAPHLFLGEILESRLFALICMKSATTNCLT